MHGAGRIRAMASAVKLRTDFSAGELWRLATAAKNANQSRRLLALAAVLDGMNRTDAARIGGMDRQTLRDWAHRFNDHDLDNWSKGRPTRLSAEQQAKLAQLGPVRTGPCMRRALAARRLATRHRRALRRRLSRAYGRQAPQGARLLPCQRPSAPPGAGRPDDRGV
ncbi:hypothetical protein MPC4_170081 [Methylocella tundrae]|uniref:Uncharacterized protein n=1 Tax=Methylocella tundrae TaxID=227605 RepID=A0A8B6M5D7_METTU|nr:hypothetical protein MPC1_20014 [Methylocella tundrae]VTZ49525.1 hypothetical protein MPC4_170056 [Methylocella tundrae]VTZ49550.1 hypothetical protein MPC4_170081 [Methylocella tundrae]